MASSVCRPGGEGEQNNLARWPQRPGRPLYEKRQGDRYRQVQCPQSSAHLLIINRPALLYQNRESDRALGGVAYRSQRASRSEDGGGGFRKLQPSGQGGAGMTMRGDHVASNQDNSTLMDVDNSDSGAARLKRVVESAIDLFVPGIGNIPIHRKR